MHEEARVVNENEEHWNGDEDGNEDGDGDGDGDRQDVL